jgi:hypothetical protein
MINNDFSSVEATLRHQQDQSSDQDDDADQDNG